MYRPRDQDVNEFNEFIDSLLVHVTKKQKLVYLMCDFNINLLNEDTHCRTNDFVNILTSHSMDPSITRPTRITSKSATLINRGPAPFHRLTPNKRFEPVFSTVIMVVCSLFNKMLLLTDLI